MGCWNVRFSPRYDIILYYNILKYYNNYAKVKKYFIEHFYDCTFLLYNNHITSNAVLQCRYTVFKKKILFDFTFTCFCFGLNGLQKIYKFSDSLAKSEICDRF